MATKNRITLKSVLNKCDSCGGNLIFNPINQKLRCEKCENSTDFEKSDKIKTHKLCDIITENPVNTNSTNFKCESCGATVMLNKFEISKICPYCETSLVADHSVMLGHKPDGVIPFVFDKVGASEKFKQNIKKHWLAPSRFKKSIPTNHIHGIYIPSFGFNVDTISTYQGRLYNEHTHRNSDGKTYTTRSYFNISGVDQYKFNDILVESSSKLTQPELSAILPYNYSFKQAYSDNFIRGYSVERYNTTVKNCMSTYKSIIDENIKRNILKQYNYDGVSSLNINTAYNNETYSYYLLPVYRFEYNYNNKPYITYMNGQTGIIDGNVPKSKLKITVLVLLFILIFALPIILTLALE